MNMPSKGETICVDGYGCGVFAGAVDLDTDDGALMLKKGDEIVEVPVEDYQKS
jgi:hypothetical protein